MKKTYAYIIIAGILIVFGVYLGYRWFRPTSSSPTIDSQTIVTMLKQEGFLITQTYIFNQQIRINKDSGNAFKDFFWGQDITASGNMKVSSGVDLRKVVFEDLRIQNNIVSLQLPPIETHSIELQGEILIQNTQGILKRIFNNENGYNETYRALEAAARNAVATTTLRLEAENSTREEISRIVEFITKGLQTDITFKK